ncbi:MAG: sigma-54 dependent transcriptional regulator [Acidobacteriota bacterium]
MSEPAAARILVVDDEVDMLETCRRILVRRHYAVQTAASPEEAEEWLARESYDLLIADLVMPGKDGLELARLARQRDPRLAVLIITAHATIDSALQATREGAFDYIPKPFTMDQLEVAVERGLDGRRLREENAALRRQLDAAFDLGNLVGASPQMQHVLDLLRRIADTEANVLITGESGTGKELVARLIHANSRHRLRPFVPLDCGALPETLIESELFGAERGAYTGAEVSRAGLVEQADGGTLFLDEIGNLPVAMQVKLLRVIQERTIRRLGGLRQIPVSIRVVAASNQELSRLVREGRFREDLFYRLNVVSVTLPPLRERAGDVRLLAQHFVTELAGLNGKDIRGLSSAALLFLERHDWPGNVRELRNVIERAVSLAESNQVMPADLPAYLTEGRPGAQLCGTFRDTKRRSVAEFEQTYLRALLEECGGNVSRAAARAGLRRTALHRLLTRHGLDARPFRPSPHAGPSRPEDPD